MYIPVHLLHLRDARAGNAARLGATDHMGASLHRHDLTACPLTPKTATSFDQRGAQRGPLFWMTTTCPSPGRFAPSSARLRGLW